MVNKVILMGKVGKDPEVRRMDNNLVFARFSLATNERWNKDGVWSEHTEWHNVIMWRSMAERAEKNVRKGSTVYIEGRLRSRSYDDKDGVKRFLTEVLADVMHLPRPESLHQYQQQPSESTAAPELPAAAFDTPTIDVVGAEPADDLPF